MKLCMGCMKQIEDSLSTCPYCGFDETTLRQESYYLTPGTIIGGKYILGRVLSYGGHTISYLGMDAEANRKVIVKEYLPSDFSTRSEGEKEVTIFSGDGQVQFETGLTNFLNEANRIEQLGEPEGIARIYDCVAENDTGYVISEYIEGQSLKQILDSGKRYSAKEAKAFIVKILKGLSKVHKMNIFHCDISPETIMVTNMGEIKLLDFGATRYVTTANSKSLSIILKRGYAPEEQYRSRGERGPWTDVYALGAVMYQMLTGIIPQESVERVLSDDLKEPSKLGVSIPENMENALMNALNVYQEERTASAEDFLKELNSSTVKRIKQKKKGNKTGKFPLWAKGLVACLAGVIVIGSAVLILNKSNTKPDDIGSETIRMRDLSGLPKTEVEEYIAELNANLGWDIKLTWGDTIFNLEKDTNDTVGKQSVNVGVVLSKNSEQPAEEELKKQESDDDTGEVQSQSVDGESTAADTQPMENTDGESEVILSGEGVIKTDEGEITTENTSTEQENNADKMNEDSQEEETKDNDEIGGGLFRDSDGMVYGTITCQLYSNSIIRYEEIRDLNAFQLAKMLDIDTSDSSAQFIGEENKETNYYDLLRLKANGKEISSEDLQTDGEITYDKDSITIVYAKTPFYYWDSLPDFVNTDWGNGVGIISGIDFPVYQKKSEDESELEPCGKEVLFESNFVQDYYSLSDSYPVGKVIEQTIQAGEKVDTSNRDWDKNGDGILLHVIKKQLSLEGESGDSAKQEIKDTFGENVTVDCQTTRGVLDTTQKVTGVWISDSKGKELCDSERKSILYFGENDIVTIHLVIAPKPTPIPKPQSQSSGGSNGGSSGGSSGGPKPPEYF